MVLVAAATWAACGSLAAVDAGVVGRWGMSTTDVALLVTAIVALLGALTSWLKAETTARDLAANSAKISDLSTTTAVHGEKINGLMPARVQEIMAPAISAAVAQAAQASALAIAQALAQQIPASPASPPPGKEPAP